MASTSNGIRRVISECDDMMGSTTNTNEAYATNTTHTEQDAENYFGSNSYPTSDLMGSNIRRHFISTNNAYPSDMTLSSQDYPMDMDNAPLTLIESNADGEDNYQDSSLSCDDSENAEDMDMLLYYHPQQGQTMTHSDRREVMELVEGALQRMDSSNSATSSGQSSQRAPSSQASNWGWFEDVHQSSDGMKSRSPTTRKNSRRPNQVAAQTDNGKCIFFNKISDNNSLN